jgi:hypothetical protein
MDKFVAAVAAFRVGDPMDDKTQLGPLATGQIREDLDKQSPNRLLPEHKYSRVEKSSTAKDSFMLRRCSPTFRGMLPRPMRSCSAR